MTYAWSKFSGPGTVTFGTATAATTTATFSTAGVYTVRLTANDGALSGFDDLVVTVNGSSGTAVYRINVAGGAFTDSQGRAWSADANFTGTTGTFAVGQPISGTVDDALYQKVRYGSSFAYALPIANGTYTVVLHVAEIWFTGAGQRVFDVAAEGGVVVDNLDMLGGSAGQFAAVTQAVQTTVADGVLNLAFTSDGEQRERRGDRGADDRGRRSCVRPERQPDAAEFQLRRQRYLRQYRFPLLPAGDGSARRQRLDVEPGGQPPRGHEFRRRSLSEHQHPAERARDTCRQHRHLRGARTNQGVHSFPPFLISRQACSWRSTPTTMPSSPSGTATAGRDSNSAWRPVRSTILVRPMPHSI